MAGEASCLAVPVDRVVGPIRDEGAHELIL